MNRDVGRLAGRVAIGSLAVAFLWTAILQADTNVSGTISTNTTWTLASSPYVVTGDVYVEGSGTPLLTIQAGVTVKFNAGTTLYIGVNNLGGLQAVGTGTSLIIFTANGSTSPGFYKGIYFGSHTTATSQLSYATVSYGGWASWNEGAIYVTACSPTISNVTVQNSAYAGISIVGASPTISSSTVSSNPWGVIASGTGSPSISSTTISSNTTGGISLTSPISMSLQTVTISSNTGFAISQDPGATLGTVSALTATGNTTNGIEIRAGTAGISATWKSTGLPYVVTGQVYVEATGTPVLTIPAGVTVKFNSNVSLYVGYNFAGGLAAVGTSGSLITFTANGSTSPGYWRGIYFGSHATAVSQIVYATVTYGGWAGAAGGIHVTACSPTISNVTVQNNAYAGISVVGGSPTISSSTVSSNPWGVIASGTGSPSISSTTISSNTTGGVSLTSPISMSLQTVTISSNTGFAISQDAGATLGTVSALTATGNTTNGIEIRAGSASISATWKSTGLPYVVTGQVYVEATGTPVLTIPAGVIVKFNSNVSLYVGLNFAGSLQAIGTSGSLITFTANGSTSPGYWRGIYFGAQAAATSQIAYATVSYGGWAGAAGGIHVGGCSPTISNVTVQNNAYAGISIVGGSPAISNSTVSSNPWGVIASGTGSPSISSTTVSSNTTGGVSLTSPISMSLQTVTISSNTGYAISQDAATTLGTVSSLTATGNTTNGIEIRAGTAGISATWKSTGLPYVVTGQVYVEATGTPVLTIPAGVTVKFNSNVSLYVGYNFGGGLQAVGTNASRILFTANTASPSAGYWRSIYFGSHATATSQIAYATVSYGGWAGTIGGIHALAASPALDHVRFDTNAYAGLSLSSSSSVITNCDFTNNTAGLVNQTPTIIADARRNWWNATSGPSGSGSGTGQSVSTGARFDPWLLAAGSSPQFISSFTLGNSTANPSIGINTVFTFATSQSGNWTVTVFNSGGGTVRTLTGTGASASPAWDGKDGGGVDQPTGAYTYQIASVAGGNSASIAKGNASLDRTKQLTISNTAVAPLYFSPNADSIQDTTTVTATSSFDGATWTVDVKNSGGTTVRSATGPAAPAINYTWDGKNGSGVTQPDGAYTLQVTLTDGPNSVPASPTTTLDLTPPTATVTAPAAGATLSNIYQSGSADVPVVGTGTDTNFQNWQVDYGIGSSPTSWFTLGTGTTPVSSSTFTTWPTYALTNGTYTVRLQVWDLAGNKSTTPKTVSVGNLQITQDVLQFNGGTGGVVRYTTIVPFTLTETLTLKNLAGQTVRTISLGSRAAGTYVDNWNGKNDTAQLLPDGPYFVLATGTAGSSTGTLDLTNQYLNDYSWMVVQAYNPSFQFYPYNNRSIPLSYNFSQPARIWVLFTVDSCIFGNDCGFSANPADCSDPGNFCLPAGEYQESGLHTSTWTGLDPSGNLRTDMQDVGVLALRSTFSKNAVVLFGSKPTLTNLTLQPPGDNPAFGTVTIGFDFTTYQSQTVSATVVITNLDSHTVLRTLTFPSVAPGHATFTWDGKAGNGMWAASGHYQIAVTVQDSIGHSLTSSALMQIIY